MKPRDVLARLRLPDGRLWVDVAVEFQMADARAVLDGERPYNFLTRSRGASKTSDLAAGALAILLGTERAARLVWLAADADQGGLAIDAIEGYLRGSGLSAEVQARRVLAPESGARLDVLPADAASAWGLSPDATSVDELANCPSSTTSRPTSAECEDLYVQPGVQLISPFMKIGST